MPNRKRTKNVLILDDDLGFAMWLGRILNDAGYSALPASRSEEAAAIIDSCFSRIDLVVANFELPGSRELVDTLSSRGEKFRLVGIGAKFTALGRRKIRATLERPAGRTPPVGAGYLKTVAEALAGR